MVIDVDHIWRESGFVMEPNRRPAVTRQVPQAVPGELPGMRRGVAAARPLPTPEVERPELLRRADALGIPWERILLEEIQAEQTLRRYAGDVDAMTLERQLAILPVAFLSSWRVRDEIQSLSCAARGACLKSAVRRLRSVFRRWVGQPEHGRAAHAGHLELAYGRVLLLQRVRHAARRSRGTTADRMAFVCVTARCGYDDAAWALGREGAPKAGHRLDEAMQKVRDEGFQIPRAASEARAFAELRRIVRAASIGPRRRAATASSADSVSLPARVGLPADGILK